MASLQAATTDEHPNSSRLPRVSASSNPIETLQSVTTYLTAQGVPSSTIIGDYAHAALYHQHSNVPFTAPTGVAAAFMNSLPPHAQNRTSLIHDHTKGVRSLSSQADLNCALVTFQPFPSDPRLLVIPLQYDSLVKISKLLGDGLADTFLAGTTAPAPATGAPLVLNMDNTTQTAPTADNPNLINLGCNNGPGEAAATALRAWSTAMIASGDPDPLVTPTQHHSEALAAALTLASDDPRTLWDMLERGLLLQEHEFELPPRPTVAAVNALHPDDKLELCQSLVDAAVTFISDTYLPSHLTKTRSYRAAVLATAPPGRDKTSSKSASDDMTAVRNITSTFTPYRALASNILRAHSAHTHPTSKWIMNASCVPLETHQTRQILALDSWARVMTTIDTTVNSLYDLIDPGAARILTKLADECFTKVSKAYKPCLFEIIHCLVPYPIFRLFSLIMALGDNDLILDFECYRLKLAQYRVTLVDDVPDLSALAAGIRDVRNQITMFDIALDHRKYILTLFDIAKLSNYRTWKHCDDLVRHLRTLRDSLASKPDPSAWTQTDVDTLDNLIATANSDLIKDNLSFMTPNDTNPPAPVKQVQSVTTTDTMAVANPSPGPASDNAVDTLNQSRQSKSKMFLALDAFTATGMCHKSTRPANDSKPRGCNDANCALGHVVLLPTGALDATASKPYFDATRNFFATSTFGWPLDPHSVLPLIHYNSLSDAFKHKNSTLPALDLAGRPTNLVPPTTMPPQQRKKKPRASNPAPSPAPAAAQPTIPMAPSLCGYHPAMSYPSMLPPQYPGPESTPRPPLPMPQQGPMPYPPQPGMPYDYYSQPQWPPPPRPPPHTAPVQVASPMPPTPAPPVVAPATAPLVVAPVTSRLAELRQFMQEPQIISIAAARLSESTADLEKRLRRQPSDSDRDTILEAALGIQSK